MGHDLLATPTFDRGFEITLFNPGSRPRQQGAGIIFALIASTVTLIRSSAAAGASAVFYVFKRTGEIFSHDSSQDRPTPSRLRTEEGLSGYYYHDPSRDTWMIGFTAPKIPGYRFTTLMFAKRRYGGIRMTISDNDWSYTYIIDPRTGLERLDRSTLTGEDLLRDRFPRIGMEEFDMASPDLISSSIHDIVSAIHGFMMDVPMNFFVDMWKAVKPGRSAVDRVEVIDSEARDVPPEETFTDDEEDESFPADIEGFEIPERSRGISLNVTSTQAFNIPSWGRDDDVQESGWILATADPMRYSTENLGVYIGTPLTVSTQEDLTSNGLPDGDTTVLRDYIAYSISRGDNEQHPPPDIGPVQDLKAVNGFVGGNELPSVSANVLGSSITIDNIDVGPMRPVMDISRADYVALSRDHINALHLHGRKISNIMVETARGHGLFMSVYTALVRLFYRAESSGIGTADIGNYAVAIAYNATLREIQEDGTPSSTVTIPYNFNMAEVNLGVSRAYRAVPPTILRNIGIITREALEDEDGNMLERVPLETIEVAWGITNAMLNSFADSLDIPLRRMENRSYSTSGTVTMFEDDGVDVDNQYPFRMIDGFWINIDRLTMHLRAQALNRTVDLRDMGMNMFAIAPEEWRIANPAVYYW